MLTLITTEHQKKGKNIFNCIKNKQNDVNTSGQNAPEKG